MRPSLRVSRSLLTVAVAVGSLSIAGGTRAEHAASAAVYVREDTDHTTVISPRLRLRAEVAEEAHVDLVYAVDVWTSASVDIVASASQPVTEQRDEIDVGADWVTGDVTLGAGYRYSTEPDYQSHGGSLSVALDLADKAATLALSAGGSFDRVGRVGEPLFAQDVSTVTSDVSFTQILDPDTLAQLVYDISLVRGYQASAYRFVALGGDGRCDGTASLCLREDNPRERLRHALALRLRRALGDSFSAGLGYRAYLDDWGIVSHTAKADLAWAPDLDTTIGLAYRFYTQSAADHYQRLYLANDYAHFTSDKELSPLSSHRVALQLERAWELPDGESKLITAIDVAPTFYRYTDYQWLDRVTALEVTAVLGMELP